jgi:hypothetical protein
MEQEHIDAIERIMGQLKCPKDFECYKSGFETLCEAKDVGLPSFVQCLGNNPEECTSGCLFRYPLGDSSYCHCCLRVYITKELKK